MQFADLHIHSFYSDGSWGPAQIIKKAKESKLDCLSLVDHDCVDGIGPLIQEAKKFDIEIIPGVELTAEYQGAELHILGYLIDWQDKYFLEKLEQLKQVRLKRIYEICDKLKNLNVNISPEEIINFSGPGTVGRLHIAQLMQKHGYVPTIFEAFQKYISDQGPAYVSKFRFSPKEAIKLISDVKGLAVLAHPYNLKKDDFIPELVDFGLKGIEVYYSEHSSTVRKKYETLCLKYNLLMTGGSDCHGQAKDEILMGKIKIPYELVQKLKKAKEEIF